MTTPAPSGRAEAVGALVEACSLVRRFLMHSSDTKHITTSQMDRMLGDALAALDAAQAQEGKRWQFEAADDAFGGAQAQEPASDAEVEEAIDCTKAIDDYGEAMFEVGISATRDAAEPHRGKCASAKAARLKLEKAIAALFRRRTGAGEAARVLGGLLGELHGVAADLEHGEHSGDGLSPGRCGVCKDTVQGVIAALGRAPGAGGGAGDG